MTVQQLFNAATLKLGIFSNVADYGTDYLPMVNDIIGDLMRQNIGAQDVIYKATVPDAASADYVSADGIPVLMPTALTNEDQIKDIALEYYDTDFYFPTETVSTKFYILVPLDYSGDIVVRYAAAWPAYTALADTLAISDSAASSVAAYGLAAALSPAVAPELTSYFEQKYAEAKRSFRKRKTSAPKRVKASYSY